MDKFSILAGIGSDWWWEMDADLRFTSLSERFTDVFGHPASFVVGKRRTDVDRTDYDNPAWRTHLDDLANRRPFRDYETTFVDANGVSRPVMISGAPLFASDGTFEGYIGVGHDLTELRRRQKEALEHAANLDSIIQSTEQGIILLDRDLKIVTYNRRVINLLDVGDGPDFQGHPYEDAVRYLADREEYGQEDKEAAIALRMRLVQSRERTSRERTRADGRVIRVNFEPLPAGGGVMTYTDITEARRSEKRLAQSEENFRQLFAYSPLPIWVYDAGTLQFLEVNDAAISKYGYSREEFLAMTLRDIRPPEDIEQLTQWQTKPVDERHHAPDWRHRCKDGRILDLEIFLRNIEFNGGSARFGIVVDQTARKQAERQTQRIFDTSLDLVHVTDSYGRLIQVSPSSQRVLGYGPEEMIGRIGQDFIFPEDVELVRGEMKALRKKSGAGHFRCRYVHKDGHPVPILCTGAWSEVDHHFFFIARDMTEDDRTQEQLRQAQKMESIGQLTGGIAHDFNNILMVIMARVENLEDEIRDPMVLDELKEISAATERAAGLTRQLLAFSRKQPLRPQSIDINDLVTTTGTLLRRTLGADIEIDSILDDELWHAEIDRTQLESSLVNLCINARDAMPNGGRLLIETVNRTLRDEYLDRTSAPVSGDYVELSVTDSGTGIAPDLLHKVFEPFFTTKGLAKATGLGLSMVYGFIKQSRGHVRIDSEVGHGTSIKLYLPRSDRGSDRAATPQQKSMPRGSERILVVEDEPQVRASVVHQLRSLGYDVTEASDGAAGLSACQSASPSYDLLLTDVVMPGPMNGKKLADEVARQWPRTKIVFMSGYTDDAIGHHGSLGAGVMLLSKPFQKRDLAQILRQALEGSVDSLLRSDQP